MSLLTLVLFPIAWLLYSISKGSKKELKDNYTLKSSDQSQNDPDYNHDCIYYEERKTHGMSYLDKITKK